MNKIELICVGHLKFKALKELEQDYLKKINFFVSFSIRTLKDVKSSDDALKIKKEGEMIGALLHKHDFVIALDRQGKTLDSLEFSRFLADKISGHPGRLVFLVGGHAGLANTLDNRIHYKLSFSKLTFAHDIFRILFLEQLYRAFTIQKGMTYHR
jgi:23S rRNA (pseudouridine1915-N3)-methyltransferase